MADGNQGNKGQSKIEDEALLERLNGLTPAEYVKLAFYALDQADVSVTSFAEANRHSRGNLDRLLDELDLFAEETL